jgi:tRNA1(Val) A37 N6-methylase TrmN6
MTPAAAAAAGQPDFTEDDFLNGRLSVLQPRRGHRSGIEAVLIAAAVPLAPAETVLDIGAGVGVAGLCALSRVDGAKAILVERDPGLGELATANAARNGMAARARVVVADIGSRGAVENCGLVSKTDHALANPPFNDPRTSRTSPDKAAAHAGDADLLHDWLRFAAAAVRADGTLTLIHRAEALKQVLVAFGQRFGGIAVLPIHPRPGKTATRILVQGRKGSRAPLSIRPGLVLHAADGHGFTPEVDAVLRGGAPLEMRG